MNINSSLFSRSCVSAHWRLLVVVVCIYANALTAAEIEVALEIQPQPFETVTEWDYWFSSEPHFDTEAASVADYSAPRSNGPCGFSLNPSGPWEPVHWNADVSDIEEREYTVGHQHYSSNSTPQCSTWSYQQITMTRRRHTTCPAGLHYHNSYAGPEFEHLCSADVNKKVQGLPNTKACGTENGNPCDAATGDKSHSEQDFASAGLEFARYYHSAAQFGSISLGHSDPTQALVGLGWGWTHTYSASIVINSDSSASPGVVIRPDGNRIVIFEAYPSTYPDVFFATDESGIQVRADVSGWALHRRDGAVEYYDSAGKLMSIYARNGQITTMEYDSSDPRLLTRIIGPFGHTLELEYDQSKTFLTTLTDSTGETISYGYENGNLKTVTYQDTSVRTYHYEDNDFPHKLTGITDENSERFSTYAYDSLGRVTDSENDGYKVVSQVFNGSTTTVTLGVGADAVSKVYDFTSHPNPWSWKYKTSAYASFDAAVAAARSDPSSPANQYLVPVSIVRGLTTGSNYRKSETVTIDSQARDTRYLSDYARRTDEIENENGNITKYSYGNGLGGTDVFHRRGVTEASGSALARTTEFEYLEDTSDLKTSISKPSVAGGANRYVTTIQYHPGTKLVWKITESGYEPDGTAIPDRVTEFVSYNTNSQVTEIDGPRTDVNDTTNLTYWEEITPGQPCELTDPGGKCGQLRSVTNALGHTTTFNDYFDDGRLRQMTDARNNVVTYTYDLRGRIDKITETPPSGPARITDYDHDDVGQLDQVALPNGLVLDYEWKTAHLLDWIEDNEGNRIDYEYDTRGNLTDVDLKDSSSTLQRAMAVAYDSWNQISSVQEGSGGFDTRYTVDPLGNVTFVKDDYGAAGSPVERSTQFIIDALNRPESSIDPQSLTTTYFYDNQDNVKEINAPKGSSSNVKTKYSYDDFGNLLKEESPDRGVTLYAYDAAGNQICRLDGRYSTGATDCLTAAGRVTFDYDALNRRTDIQHQADSSKDVQFVYDFWAKPNDLTFIRSANRNDYIWSSFDAFGNLKAQWDYIDNGSGDVESLETYYGYDSNYNLATITYPKPHPSESSGRVVTYNRDTMGRVVGITASFKGNNLTIIDGSASSPGVFYKPFGPVTQINFGNGVTQDWLYDDAYSIEQITVKNSSSTNLLDWVYVPDAAGNVDAITKSGTTTSYDHDIMDRLTGEGATVYSYDGNGNITQSGAFSLTYVSSPESSNRIATRAGATVVHDTMGNVTADGGIVAFSYDAGGRLNTMTRTPVGQPVQTFTNQYNGKGERSFTHRVLSPSERYVEFYTYAEDGRLLTFVQSAQNTDNSLGVRTVYNFIWLENIPVAQFRDRYDSTGGYIDSQLTYIHADHLYTPRIGTGYSAATQNDETVVWSIWSNAYGYAFTSNDPDGDKLMAGSSTVDIALRFPGQVYYGVSTYNYNYYRDYDTVTGRYLESDPIGLAGGMNTYGYVGGNPSRWVDRLGLTREDIDRVNEHVRVTQPDLNTDRHIGTFPMPGDGYRAITNPITRNITIDSYYLKDNLSARDLILLEEILIHESIHRTRPRRDSILRPFRHDDIYIEAARRRNSPHLTCPTTE